MNYLSKCAKRCRAGISAALSASVLLVGCASIPDVTVAYRPVKWALLATVAHTITCNRDKTLAIVERGAVFLPLYSAAPPDSRFQIRLKDLDGYAADADISIALTEDGRLKSINHATTGQGEATAKSLVGFATVLSARTPSVSFVAPSNGSVSFFSSNKFKATIEKATPSAVCEVVQRRSVTAPDQLVQVSLVQGAYVRPDSGSSVEAKPSKDQEALLLDLKSAGLDLAILVSTKLSDEELQPVSHLRSVANFGEVPVTLQRMRSFSVEAKDAVGAISSKTIPVPTNEVFVLPIPKAALFGKQNFTLTLADSGRITNIGYGATAGAAGALGAAGSLAGSEVLEDNLEAAAIKAASDLIAQQQRYNNCRLKPSECK